MGDPACWLHLACASCGVVDDDLDEDRRCRPCRDPQWRVTGPPTATTQDRPADGNETRTAANDAG